jgi:tetratricopeptide (TPR) repeat protein
VVLISIDTLRSDHLPAYGNERIETPAIDSLVADGILFERAFSHYPLTLPAHVSIFTGLLPDQHGVRDNLGYSFTASDVPYLPRLFQEKGYATGGAVSAFVLREDTGIAAGFDFFEDEILFREWVPGGDLSRRGDATLAAILPWLRSVAEKPFFLFFHIYEPHTPYEAPEPFVSKYGQGYEAEVAAADAVVGELLTELKRLEVYDRAVVVLLSDHGEGLREHGEAEHGVLLYREAIQVPLILKLPGRLQAGTRVAAPAQLVDLVPTLTELVGGPTFEESAGTNLLALPEDPASRRIYSETFYPRIHYGWSDLASLIEGRFHYIHGPDPELYDLLQDPGETHNILRDERRVYAGLRDHLDTYQRELEPPEPVDEETRMKLAALGYLDVNFGDTSGPLPDPKSRLSTLDALWNAFDLRREGRPEEAVAAARRALAENPDMTDAWQVLGSSLEDLRRFDEALAAYNEALARGGPRADVVLAAARVRLELGQIEEGLEGVRYAREQGVVNPESLRQVGLQLAEVGKIHEALDLLEEMAVDDTSESLNALGRVQSEAGLQQEALATLQRVLEQDPTNAKAHQHISLVYLRLERWSAARQSAERALELDPQLSQAWNNLGVALHFLGEAQEALAAWEKAVELDPKEYDALLNLGLRAAAVGEIARSRSALQRFVDTAPPALYRDDIEAAKSVLRQLPG